MNPTWTSDCGTVRLWLGDCRNVLPALEGVAAIITDIPYGEVNRPSGGLRNLDKGEADVVTFPLSFAIEQSERLAQTVYIFCGTEQISELREGFVRFGMTTRLCVWEKSNPSPMNGERLWLSSIETCIFARKPLAYFGEHCESPVWRGPIEREQVHPTQKPLWLMERLVRASTVEGDEVLDFCMGSGTTIVACIRAGRRAIGLETKPQYFEIAKQRIQAELTRMPLFAEQTKQEQAELFTE